MTLYSYMGILVDMSGILCEDFAQGLDRCGSECADWDINDVFNDSTTQEATGTVT